MANRRRNSGDVAFSLLSFQDAITGVIGVILLIAIILCLQLVSQPADATAVAEPVPDDDPVEQIQKYKAARARFEGQAHDHQGQIARIQKAIEHIERLPPSETTAPPSIEDLKSAMAGITSEILQKREAVKDLAKEVGEIARDTQAAERRAVAIIDQAEEDLKEADNAPPHLTVVRGLQGMVPVLIELTGTELVIGRLNPDGTTTAEAKHPASRLEAAAEETLRSLEPARHAVVVFVHPGASDHLHVVREIAQRQGLTIGWDLAPERPVFTAGR